MRRAPALTVAALLAIVLGPPGLRAQRAEPGVRVEAGIEVGALHGRRALGARSVAGGVFVAAERRLSRRAAARASLGIAETGLTAEVVADCPADVPCLGGRTFPLRVGTLELHGLYAPFDPLPLRLIGGGGLAFLVGQRRIARVTEHMEYDRALKGMARVGAHLALGRSARAPRLQYSRAWLSGAFEAFDRSDALALVLVF
ncbi:MAG: hypothetical protein IPJ56_16430 [Gemmatimonadetes bacterium]|nr:hypothetical protein [Gemmatimonadota bacterium]